MIDEIVIRRATLTDIPACARIVTDWERGTGYLHNTPETAVIERLITEAFPDREIWVTGTPVDGYMSVDPKAGKLGAIYLTRPGNGLGKRLLDRAKEGRDFLWLTVYEPNTRAQSFYRREGFRFADKVPTGDPAPVGDPQVLRMVWQRSDATS